MACTKGQGQLRQTNLTSSLPVRPPPSPPGPLQLGPPCTPAEEEGACGSQESQDTGAPSQLSDCEAARALMRMYSSGSSSASAAAAAVHDVHDAPAAPAAPALFVVRAADPNHVFPAEGTRAPRGPARPALFAPAAAPTTPESLVSSPCAQAQAALMAQHAQHAQ